jgi:uncharacterized membrane protein
VEARFASALAFVLTFVVVLIVAVVTILINVKLKVEGVLREEGDGGGSGRVSVGI